eukprot:288543-Prorocentrum_minimum.AAC.1
MLKPDPGGSDRVRDHASDRAGCEWGRVAELRVKQRGRWSYLKVDVRRAIASDNGVDTRVEL